MTDPQNVFVSVSFVYDKMTIRPTVLFFLTVSDSEANLSPETEWEAGQGGGTPTIPAF